jgi:hypothetical protein
VKAVATARRKVFFEAQHSFRGLPRLVPPVEPATTSGRPRKAATVARVEQAREPLAAQRHPLSSQRLADLLLREKDSRAFLARELRQSTRDGTSTHRVERFTAQTPRHHRTQLAQARRGAQLQARQIAHRQPPQVRPTAAVPRQNISRPQRQVRSQQSPARAHAASRSQASSRQRSPSSASRQGAHSAKKGR